MSNIYSIISNRAGEMASTDDLEHAGRIVDALMLARDEPFADGTYWADYWVRDEAGNEYYWDKAFGTVFSAACFEPSG